MLIPSFSQWSSICRAIQYITRERRLFVSSNQSSAFAPDVSILFPLQLEVGTIVVIVFDGIGNDHYYGWSQFLVLPTVFAPNSTSIVFRSLCLCLPIHRMAVYARLCALLFSPNHPKSRSIVDLFRSSDLTWFSAPQGRLIESAKTSPSVRRTDTSLQKHGSDIMGTPSRTESPWT